MPLFSVIIPLYNKENWIGNTLQSVLSQTFSDFEVIIVNDGSTDNGASIAESFQDERIYLFSKENGGVSAARNFGIEKATSNYIAFLDADDFWYPNFLKNMVSMINQFPEEKVFSSAIEIEIKGKFFEADYSIPKTDKLQVIDFFKGSSNQTAIFTSSAIFKKSIFDEIGNFDTTLKTGEDIDLWIRIGLKFMIVFSWKIEARYCDVSNSLSKNNIDYSEKPDFLNYSEFESSNKYIRKYLDLNRFSIAVRAKIANQKTQFIRFKNLINFDNLNWKQRLLLQLPRNLLRIIYRVKSFLHGKNIRLSAFK